MLRDLHVNVFFTDNVHNWEAAKYTYVFTWDKNLLLISMFLGSYRYCFNTIPYDFTWLVKIFSDYIRFSKISPDSSRFKSQGIMSLNQVWERLYKRGFLIIKLQPAIFPSSKHVHDHSFSWITSRAMQRILGPPQTRVKNQETRNKRQNGLAHSRFIVCVTPNQEKHCLIRESCLNGTCAKQPINNISEVTWLCTWLAKWDVAD